MQMSLKAHLPAFFPSWKTDAEIIRVAEFRPDDRRRAEENDEWEKSEDGHGLMQSRFDCYSSKPPFYTHR